ncbi:MAG: glycosyltransferase, partial [Thermoleophilia bacterium]|nr:glycosyltransferase [Thermoleophilia bacterium]
MIPLSYRLRERVRVEDTGDGRWRALCDLPLSVVSINAAAARLLTLTRGGVDVSGLAGALSVDEERVLKLCEYFRGKGMLDVTSTRPDPPVTPMVSVIVPTKDREAELDECLAALSVLDYPRDRYEVIVVDDGSTDGTVAVAGRYPCHLVSNGRNRGQSYSRNVGVQRASGEILAFLDSDCVAEPHWLRDLS